MNASTIINSLRPSYQVALVDATAATQNVLTNKQATSAEAGSLASNLYDLEYEASILVLEEDAAVIEAIAKEGSENEWDEETTDLFNKANQVYQNDTSVSQVGQSNANTAVQAQQTQVSQDGTNLSNALSLSNILMEVGRFMTNLLVKPYA